jgi:hypothetical protein
MLDSGERASIYVSLVAAILAAIIAFGGGYFLWRGGDFEQLKVSAPKVVPLMMPSGSSLSEVWFSSSGLVFSTFEAAQKLNIAAWDLQGRARGQVRVLDFSVIKDAKDVKGLSNSFHGNASDDLSPESFIPYHVSDEGNTIAWAVRGKIYLGPIRQFPNIKGQRIGSAPVSAISIARPGVVMAVDTADRFVALDYAKGKPLLEVPFNRGRGPRLIWGRGKFRVLSAQVTANAYVFSAQRSAYEALPAISGGSSFAVSSSGVAYSGTGDGIIIVPQRRGLSPFLALENMRRVLALAVYDESTVLAGGDGRSLFLVKDGAARPLTTVPEGVKFLAVNRNHIAYATADRLVLGRLDWKPAFSDKAKRWLAYMLSAVSIIGFLRVISIDVIRLTLDRRERKSEAPLEEPLKEGPEGTPIKTDLDTANS